MFRPTFRDVLVLLIGMALAIPVVTTIECIKWRNRIEMARYLEGLDPLIRDAKHTGRMPPRIPEEVTTPDTPDTLGKPVTRSTQIELVKPVAKITPINWRAFAGADVQCIQLVLHSPQGTKVPLFPGDDPESRLKQNWYGFTVDYRGVAFDRAGNPIPETTVYAGYANIAAAARLSNTISELNNEFCTIQANTAAHRGRVEDKAFHDWSDAMLGIGHFTHQGYEYEVDNKSTYAVGPDTKVYRAENPGCFNENFKIIKLR